MDKPSFVQGAIVGLVVGGAALVAASFFGFFDNGIDEDDRPPIIVNNGSIQFFAVPILGVPGDWQQDGQNWRHAHGKGGPQKFTVHVGGATNANLEACDEPKYKNIRKIGLSFSADGASPLIVDVDGAGATRYLRVAVGNYDASATGPLLRVGAENDKLRRAVLYDNAQTNSVKATCDFDAATAPPWLLIEQKR